MYTLEELQKKVEEIFAKESFSAEPKELYAPIVYTMNLGGKRIRPLLTLLACDMFGGDVSKAISPAIGLEVFHNFTLLHDDIMDNSPLRRGKETVFKRWNTNVAILSGDTMFAIAYQYFLKENPENLKEILAIFTKTAIEVCDGQQYDMNFETMQHVSITDYMKMIRLKTGVLLACALSIGALVANASKKDVQQIYNFGIELGLAFQLQDDFLDCYGDTKVFGKMTGTDIADNKKTVLYIKALELANDETKITLQQLFQTQGIPREEKETLVKSIYEKLEVKKIVGEEINYSIQKALHLLNTLKIPDERKTSLNEFVHKLIGRNF